MFWASAFRNSRKRQFGKRERYSVSEKLSSHRSEVDSLNRVIESVARRIEEIRNQLKAIKSVVGARKEDGGVS